MEQLIMRWRNDGKKTDVLDIPKDIEIKNWVEIDNPLDNWLDIIQHGLTKNKKDEEFYKQCNYRYEYYKPEDCFFFLYKGSAVSTITIICNPVKKEGYIHMVATKTEARGKGIVNLMSLFAVKILKENGMETAYLTTDDFRIPAIKTYLKSGFYPDVSTDDFKLRWENINKIISKE